MENVTPWHDQDAFWETAAPIIFTEQRWSNAPAEVEKVISLLDIKPGIHILDLGCGVGRHSLELARRGFNVTGVDRTERYLEQASEKAVKEGLNVEFIQEDMRTFCQPNAFDSVISLFTSFGYFEDPEEDRQVVMNVYRSLKSGGVFLIDIMGKEVLARIFRERDWREENGVLILEERKLIGNWELIESRWIIIKDNKRTELKFTSRPYSAVELVSLLTGCGFTQVDMFGDLAGSPYDHMARRLVAVAHK